MVDVRQRHTTVGHIFGANFGTHARVMYDAHVHKVHMIDVTQRRTTVGHIFGANCGPHACVMYDTYVHMKHVIGMSQRHTAHVFVLYDTGSCERGNQEVHVE